jgi:tRNA(fMet)-specific endonuclease VapC
LNRYLLDTNIVSDLVSHPAGQVARKIATLRESSMLTSIIVVMEIKFGVEKRGSRKLARQVAKVLGELNILSIEPPLEDIYARVRTFLERRGTPIGAHDLLIATQALGVDATVVTDNEREYRRVPGLRVENWLRQNPARGPDAG